MNLSCRKLCQPVKCSAIFCSKFIHSVVVQIFPFFFIDRISILGLLIKNFFTLLSVVSISASYFIEMSQMSVCSLRVAPFSISLEITSV